MHEPGLYIVGARNGREATFIARYSSEKFQPQMQAPLHAVLKTFAVLEKSEIKNNYAQKAEAVS